MDKQQFFNGAVFDAWRWFGAHLGGGGHKQAAGCELLGSLENAKSAVLAEVEKELCRES